MSDFYPFIIAGLVSGAVYGLAATGLVLTYKTSGIFNFAHGAMAAAGAYLFYQVRQQWGLPWPVAFVVAVLVAGPIFGLVLERLAHALSGTTTAAKIVATVGLLIGVQGLLAAIYGGETRASRAFLPTKVLSLGSINVGVDQILVFVIAVSITLALTIFLRSSRVGTAMRGVVDDPDLLDLAGTSPTQVRRLAWTIGTLFAALSGVLLAPAVGLDPLLLTLLVVQAFGAAAIGRFASLPLSFVGGLVIGLGQAICSKYVNNVHALAGLPPSLPFIVFFGVLLLTRRGRLVELGALTRKRREATGADRRRIQIAGAVALLALVASVPAFASSRLPVFTAALIYVLVFASLRLLVGTSGQVSLCHVAFAAVGATSFAHFAGGAGLPWAVALLAAGLVAVPVGAFVAIPAIRLSGLYLALATLGFGILMERLVYPMGVMFGVTGLAKAPRPHLGFVNVSSDKGFYLLCLAIVVLGMLLIRVVTQSWIGRVLRAMSDSPLALTTLGSNVNATRVFVFCLSAFLAGIGGALYASFSGTTSGISFTALLSLTLIVVLAINGNGELRAPVGAAFALYVIPSYIRNETFNEYLPVLFGVTAVAVSVLSNQRYDPAARLHNLATASRRRARATRVTLRLRRATEAA